MHDAHVGEYTLVFDVLWTCVVRRRQCDEFPWFQSRDVVVVVDIVYTAGAKNLLLAILDCSWRTRTTAAGGFNRWRRRFWLNAISLLSSSWRLRISRFVSRLLPDRSIVPSVCGFIRTRYYSVVAQCSASAAAEQRKRNDVSNRQSIRCAGRHMHPLPFVSVKISVSTVTV